MQEEASRSVLSSKGFLASAAFVVLLVIGLLWLLVDGGGQRAALPPSPASTSTAPGPTAAGAGEMSGECRMPAGDQRVPSGSLGTEEIRISPDLVVPFVPEAGPGIKEPVSRCFVHSPTGAVVAAANFLKWLSSQQKLDEVTGTLIAPGADRDRMLQEVRDTWDGSTGPAVRVLGYKAAVRSRDEVLVTLVVALPSDLSRMVSWQLVMTWVEDDWKVRPSPTGDWVVEPVTSLSGEGFSSWKV